MYRFYDCSTSILFDTSSLGARNFFAVSYTKWKVELSMASTMISTSSWFVYASLELTITTLSSELGHRSFRIWTILASCSGVSLNSMSTKSRFVATSGSLGVSRSRDDHLWSFGTMGKSHLTNATQLLDLGEPFLKKLRERLSLVVHLGALLVVRAAVPPDQTHVVGEFVYILVLAVYQTCLGMSGAFASLLH